MNHTMTKDIGKIATLEYKGMHIDVEILDVAQKYGNTRYLVKPVSGIGEVWVQKGITIK